MATPVPEAAPSGPPSGEGVHVHDQRALAPPSGPVPVAKAKDNDDRGGIHSRVRARSAAKPARYRDDDDVKMTPTNSARPNKSGSATTSSSRQTAAPKAEVEAVPPRPPLVASASRVAQPPAPKKPKGEGPAEGTCNGPWTRDEHEQFEAGCLLHGWGNWRALEAWCIPTRTRSQIKSHAQKFGKHHPDIKKKLELEYNQRLIAIVKQEESSMGNYGPATTKASKEQTNKNGASAVKAAKEPKKKSGASVVKASKAKSGAKKRKPSPEAGSKAPASPTAAESKSKKRSTPSASSEAKPSKSPTAAKPSKGPTAAKLSKSPAAANIEKAAPVPETCTPGSPAKSANAKPSKPIVKKKSKPSKPPAPKKRASVAAKIVSPAKKSEAKTVIKSEAKSEAKNVVPGKGGWSPTEQAQFEEAVVLHGWGNWIDAEQCIPTRTAVQVKSHAQKFFKHRPGDKARLVEKHRAYLREHGLKPRAPTGPRARTAKTSGVKRIKRESTSEWRGIAQRIKKESTSGNPKSSAPGRGNGAAGIPDLCSWSDAEKSQFEDGCILHGWGNWDAIASLVPTKNASEVMSLADVYESRDAHRKKWLETEHELLDLQRKSAASITPEGSDDAEVHHTLRDLRLKGLMSPASVRMTSGLDFGAAKAIMALNFSSWDNAQDGQGEPSRDRSDTDLKGKSKASEMMSKSSEDDASVLSHLVEEKSSVVTADEEVARVSPSLLNIEARSKSAARVSLEPNDDDTSTLKEPRSNCAGLKRAPVLTCPSASMESAQNTQSAPIRTCEVKSCTNQPPPHWLAADTWNECMDNIYRWNHHMSGDEQNLEFQKYSLLPGREKERLRDKLVTLMNDRF